jgi:hypothetical protein
VLVAAGTVAHRIAEALPGSLARSFRARPEIASALSHRSAEP